MAFYNNDEYLCNPETDDEDCECCEDFICIDCIDKMEDEKINEILIRSIPSDFRGIPSNSKLFGLKVFSKCYYSKSSCKHECIIVYRKNCKYYSIRKIINSDNIVKYMIRLEGHDCIPDHFYDTCDLEDF